MHIQNGIIAIPKSTHIEYMQENFNVFDFMLADEDMTWIVMLETKASSFFSHQDLSMLEWFAKMLEECKHKHDTSKEKRIGKVKFCTKLFALNLQWGAFF